MHFTISNPNSANSFSPVVCLTPILIIQDLKPDHRCHTPQKLEGAPQNRKYCQEATKPSVQ